MKTKDVIDLADRTANAYSFDRYGRTEWRKAIRLLAGRKFTPKQIEALLESKYMRWAADAADHSRGLAADLERFLDVHLGARIYTKIAELAPGEPTDQIVTRTKLVAPKTGADLAGDCTGEDIADLIDLALAARDEAAMLAANPKDAKLALEVLQDRAKAILTRIEARK